MNDGAAQSSAITQQSPEVGQVRNQGEPILIKNIEIHGISMEAGVGGQTIRVAVQGLAMSDSTLFHRIMRSMVGVINSAAAASGAHVNIERADTILLVIKEDRTAELWLDAATEAVRCLVKRQVQAGGALFQRDIADIVGYSFPNVVIETTDQVFCVLRQAWHFGLAYDFNPRKNLDRAGFERSLGVIKRYLSYGDEYQALSNTQRLQQLIAAGWFPFVEVLGDDIRMVIDAIAGGIDLESVERQLVERFDAERLDHMLARWRANPHFIGKMDLMVEAVDAFKSKRPISAIKVALTEIEGILNEMHRAANGGSGAKTKALLDFLVSYTEAKVGEPDTLLFPAAFAKYLRDYTFANFDPTAQAGEAGSRHAVGHGAAAQATYTMTRALQTILAIDQLAFYSA